MEGKARGSGWSVQRLNFQGHNGGFPHPAPPWSIAIGPVSLVLEMGWVMGLDTSQQFEMSLCSPIAFEFLPCYNRSSLLAQAKLNPSFPIVGGAQGKISCALIFGPFPKAFSPPLSAVSPPSLANHKKRLQSFYQFAKHLLLLFGIVWGWGDRGFDWPHRTYYIWYIVCQTWDPSPHSFPCFAFNLVTGFLSVLFFQGPGNWINCSRVNCPFSASASGPAFSHSLPLNKYEKLTASLFLVSSGASGEEVVHKRDSWFTDHLFMLSQGQHSSAPCPYACLAGQTSIQTAGMEALGSSKIRSPMPWNALLPPFCSSASFPNSLTQMNARSPHSGGFSWPSALPTAPPTMFHHCAHLLFGSCLAASHITSWSFPWYWERVSRALELVMSGDESPWYFVLLC